MSVPGYTVSIEGGAGYLCREDESVLAGMHRLGRRGIPQGCRGGGCGVCKVEVLSGQYTQARMSRDHVSVEDEASGRVLACRIFPRSNLQLRVIGKLQKSIYRAA